MAAVISCQRRIYLDAVYLLSSSLGSSLLVLLPFAMYLRYLPFTLKFKEFSFVHEPLNSLDI